ncbi:MAG: DUF6079 family protein [Spirochaetia bacterium]|jgi:hypothetical protein
MSEHLSIGDLIDVPPIRTVIRLAEGTEQPEQIASSFVFTPEVFAHFSVLAEALASGKGQGYFLQGDFGSGKSHFLAALRAWVSGSPGAGELARRHAGLGRLSATGARFVAAAISLVDHRASSDLESIVLETVARELGADADEWRGENRLDTFTRMLETARATGRSGIVLLVDELSEFLRSKPSPQALNEDARTLQLLGEMASSGPLWIVAAVQESIERTGDLSQAIVRKIKDRFPVKMALSTLHIKALLSERLVRLKPGAGEALYRIYEQFRGQFPGFSSSFEEFRAVYPVHPKTISLLEGLGGLFSQHRGIVDFVHSRIAGDAARGIPSHLSRPASELLAPDSIYDHFSQRLAEFSAFHIYPRHIVPHLDDVIEHTLATAEDRLLCRRVVRMLVLYRIHPTATPPSVAELAELASCSLDAHSPELNARFLAEAILDPVAASSRFLSRAADPGGDPRKATYRIVTEDDPAKLLAARISRMAAEPAADDSRLLRAPLARLSESDAWPGKAVLTEGMRRSVTWLGSERKAFLCFLSPGEEDAARERIGRECAADVDFAVVFSVGQTAFAAEHTAVWEVPVPQRQEVLREFLASLLVAAELRPGNPAEAPLISEAQEQVSRRQAAACQAALEAFYQGEFSGPGLRVEASVRQLRRFDRLLECAAEGLLEKRYPRFRDVAPRRFPASSRMYQQLLEEFIAPGSLSLNEARARSLGPAIDGLAFPLGLVEIKRSSYHFAPNIAEHALLTFFFSLLRPASATPMAQVLERLQRDVFGLPHDTALFLVAALAVGGLVSARRSGRSIPLEQLGLQTVEKAEQLLPGELIGSADRSTLLAECAFLAPAAAEEAFGLRQQRDAWKEVIKLRDLASSLIADIRQRVTGVAEFSAFSAFDFKAFEAKLTGLETVAREIKPSLGAKEGLERFLAAWRGTGLTADDVELLKGLGRFLSQGAEQFVFVAHYLRHPAVDRAAAMEPQLAALREEIHALIATPASGVLPDGGERLATLFAHFRERYTLLYSGMHAEFYRTREPAKLSRQVSRAVGALRLLASIDSLDRPPDLGRFLELLEPRAPQRCDRHVSEELLRGAVCGCGFQPGDTPAIERPDHPEEQIEKALASFVDGLHAPRVREAVAARAFALQDANPGVAKRLGELASALSRQALSPAALIDLLDASLCHEIEQALAGRVPVVHLSLDDLARKVAGRRLPAERIEAAVREWLSDAGRTAGGALGADGGAAGTVARPEAGPTELIAVEAAQGDVRAPGSYFDPMAWWPLLHPGLLRAEPLPGDPSLEQTSIAAALETRYPSARLAEEFRQARTDGLLRFVSREPLHTQAVRAAWLVIAERVLGGERLPTPAPPDSLLADAAEAARVISRLRAVIRYAALREQAFPERLEARLCIDAIIADPWSTDELRRAAEHALADMETTGSRWLASLPAAAALSLRDNPVVLVMDGVSADLWLANAESLTRAAPGARWEWLRLDGNVATPDSLALQLGIEGDPLDVLAANGIPYVQLSGREENLAAALSGGLSAARSPGQAAVARIALVDRAAHRGELRLGAMAEALASLLEQRLAEVVSLCQSEGKPLVLTADHGLSLVGGRLTHGGGGVYERAICRITWRSARKQS